MFFIIVYVRLFVLCLFDSLKNMLCVCVLLCGVCLLLRYGRNSGVWVGLVCLVCVVSVLVVVLCVCVS